MLMVWRAGRRLPLASVAVHGRTCTTGQLPLLLSTKVNVGLASQVSVAVAVAKLGVAGQSIVLGTGKAAITGGVMSRTLMVWLAVLLLPQASVAVQVRTCTTGQLPLLLSTKVNDGLASQVSVAVAVAKLGAAGQSIVLGTGKAAITGAVMSRTLMVWLAVLLLPQASVVVPYPTRIRSQLPLLVSTKLNVGVASQVSVAVAVAKLGAAGQSIVLGTGKAAITGGVMSRTLMVWLAVLLLPQASVAVQVRTCTTGQLPLLLSTKVNDGLASQVSVAVAVAKLGAAGQSIVLGTGKAAITGAVMSRTLMVWLAVLLLPQASVVVPYPTRIRSQLPLLVSTKLNVGVASQVSVAVAVAKLGAAGQSIVLGTGKAAITGAVLSRTLMVWLAVLLLPQASVAVQVRTCTTGQLPLLLSTKLNVGLASQVSVAVAVAKLGAAGQSIVLGTGKAANTAGVMSLTLMVWLAVLLLPQASVAVQVRTCTTGQLPLLLSTKVNVGLASHASVAVAVAKLGVAGQSIVLAPGKAAIAGAVMSRTLMVWLAVLLLPQASTAVQVRTCTTGQVPLLVSTKVNVGLASQVSVAVAVAKLGVAGQSIVLGTGKAAITGAVRSRTLMVWLAVLLLPQASVAVQVRTCTTGQLPLLLSTKVNVGLASQVSVAVAVAKLGAAGQSIVLGADRNGVAGGEMGRTLRVRLAVLVVPHAACAVQVRTCTTGQLPLLVSTKVNVGLASQVSVAVAVAKLGAAGQSIVLGTGKAAITGRVISRTLMVWLAVLLLPQASVAVQVRTCTTGQLPLLLSTTVNVGLASQVSVAVAVAKLGAAGQSIVLGTGKAAINGAVVSRTLMVWLA